MGRDTKSPRTRKTRYPKACTPCRSSKVKCDEKRPCSRCRHLAKVCTFVERPKTEQELKMESLEREVESLKDLVRSQSQKNGQEQSPGQGSFSGEPLATPTTADGMSEPAVYSPATTSFPCQQGGGDDPSIGASSWQSDAECRSPCLSPQAPLADFIAAGLLSASQASAYFGTFFDGCDRYVPILDAQHDTAPHVRARSSLLFCVVCAVGYRVVHGTDGPEWHRLDVHVRRMLAAAVASGPAAVETVQALLVRACYAPERTLLLAVATRLAVELRLPAAYAELGRRVVAGAGAGRELMRRTRAWLHLLVLANMLHVDAGHAPAFHLGGHARRCRVLLDSRLATARDVSLFSQVELNVLRADIAAKLQRAGAGDERALGVVADARIDIDVWCRDWLRILDGVAGPDGPWLRQNLLIQRCWAESMALCRAVRACGVDNVAAMTGPQRHMLAMAKTALEAHFGLIMAEPRTYLGHLRFAMDFVWAKCAFCFLLLLKLSVLLPDAHPPPDLLADGATLVAELRAVAGSGGANHVYLQLLQSALERHRRGADAAAVPEPFVSEWDFPGLSLFSAPMDWLDELLAGPFGIEDEPIGLAWLQA